MKIIGYNDIDGGFLIQVETIGQLYIVSLSFFVVVSLEDFAS